MPKFIILAVLVGAAVFAAVSLANNGSGGTIRAQLPGEAKTLNAHQMTRAQGKALGVEAAAKRSKFGLRYYFALEDLAVSFRLALMVASDHQPITGPRVEGWVLIGSHIRPFVTSPPRRTRLEERSCQRGAFVRPTMLICLAPTWRTRYSQWS